MSAITEAPYLRRTHPGKMLSVIFRIPDGERVYVGRYNEPHSLMAATEASAWVAANPDGAQLIISRSVARREIVHIRETTQLVG